MHALPLVYYCLFLITDDMLSSRSRAGTHSEGDDGKGKRERERERSKEQRAKNRAACVLALAVTCYLRSTNQSHPQSPPLPHPSIHSFTTDYPFIILAQRRKRTCQAHVECLLFFFFFFRHHHHHPPPPPPPPPSAHYLVLSPLRLLLLALGDSIEYL